MVKLRIKINWVKRWILKRQLDRFNSSVTSWLIITQWLLAPRGLHTCRESSTFPSGALASLCCIRSHSPSTLFNGACYRGSCFMLLWWHIPQHKSEARRSQLSVWDQPRILAAAAAAAAGKGTAPTNASELLWSQPDHLCVHLQTEPSCWHMRGADHPLCRYVNISAWKHFEDCLWSAERY